MATVTVALMPGRPLINGAKFLFLIEFVFGFFDDGWVRLDWNRNCCVARSPVNQIIRLFIQPVEVMIDSGCWRTLADSGGLWRILLLDVSSLVS